jgi:hypothetical protein
MAILDKIKAITAKQWLIGAGVVGAAGLGVDYYRRGPGSIVGRLFHHEGGGGRGRPHRGMHRRPMQRPQMQPQVQQPMPQPAMMPGIIDVPYAMGPAWGPPGYHWGDWQWHGRYPGAFGHERFDAFHGGGHHW